ncbi:MAG TPA: GcrA family cell cycle regulator [Acetobacteraceae bacterium]|nr:GcrA family cell cycle regulator [Acetobacteraceae bacterium]
MEWSEESIAQLRMLWAEGLSTAEIGRRMGVSKNAIVGKAHRLSLDARPSPIRRGGEGVRRPRPPRPVSGPTLPPLAAMRPAAEMRTVEARPGPMPPRPMPAPPPRPVVVARPARSRQPACCWPIGEPGTPSFRFCEAEAMPAKPYCQEHAALAYVKVRDRRDDAA